MSQEPWRILVVDDDEDVHQISHLALKRKSWQDRGFEIHDAHSAEEGRRVLRSARSPFHVAIVDVVMETDNAGLELCRFIRSTFASSLRIVLRTGQPGVAPEEYVLDNYDIDHYLAKSEATAPRLFAAIRACLRTSVDLDALENTNASLVVANSQLQRQIALREDMIRAVEEASTGPLGRLLATVESDGFGASTVGIRFVAEQARSVAELLRSASQPRDFRQRTEAALQSKSIVVLLEERKSLRLARRALAGTNSAALATDSWEEAHKSVCTGNVDLLYVDWKNLALLGEASRHNPMARAVLLTSQTNFEEQGDEIMTLPIGSAVVIGNAHAEEKEPDPLLVQELVVTAGKLLSNDLFGLEKYLAWGIRVHEERLTDSQDRPRVLETLRSFANACGVRPNLQRKLVRLADELMMNGLWDAPANELGEPKYNQLSRSEPLVVEPHEAITVRWASDGNLLALSCSDNFGRLTKKTAVRYLKTCFANEMNPLKNDEGGGAGLGLYMAYLAISTFVINVEPGKKTEVLGIINLANSDRGSSSRARSFHYFKTT